MADQIQDTVNWAIHEGRLEDFKALTAEATASASANAPNMLGYHWYVNEEQ